ncbi:type II secretion system secretin GspD [Desulfobacter curvatus]|uniref:type II secretion system secretin GspD n=1 Tax=Desulfobacter curvatus TaxID=2290 RepID=UPI000364B869|nr:type II secretion system secretin GspD [Desulfobacter curvatus]
MLQDRRNSLNVKHICLILVVLALVGLCPVQAAQNQDTSEFVSMDFNDVDIGVFIKFISKLTNKNFVVDTKVKGKVTIISPEKISVNDAYKVFESVLDIYGFATVETGSVVKIIPAADARGDNVDTRLARDVEQASDKLVTRLIPLTYASSDELKSLLSPMLAKGSLLLSHADSNMLIATATLASIDRLLKLINTIDVEGVGRKITILPIKYADAEKMVTNLTKIYSAKTKKNQRSRKKNSEDLSVEMVADERTNSIILLASEQESAQITTLVDALDKEVPKGEEKIRVYYLEHATAEDLAAVLQEIPEKSSNDSKKAGQKKAPLLSDDIKITADKATNSLIIIADKDDYPVLEEVIKKLDVPRSMVYIECLLMEMNAERSLDFGMEWQAKGTIHSDNTGFGRFSTSNSDSADLGSLADRTLSSGFSMGVFGGTLEAIIQAYKKDSDVKILSTPQLLTTENEEATITIGKNVPYQTRGGVGTSDTDSTAYNSYEYKDVGITLKITPSISQDRLVRLDFYQTVTKLDTATNTTVTDRPTTLKRELETTIIVEDGNTVVLGGLIDESLSKEVGKVPCLGDIPLLGNAFKNQSSGSDRTNLFIFLTPRVVKNTLETKKIYHEKKEEMDELHKQEIKLYDEDSPIKSMLLN